MKKLIFMFLALTVLAKTHAQIRIDTIDVNTEATTYLIFPEAVSVIDIGNKYFAGKVEGKVVFIKALPSSQVFKVGSTSIYIGYGNESFMGVLRYRPVLHTFFHDYTKAKKIKGEEEREAKEEVEALTPPNPTVTVPAANAEVNRYEALRLKLEGIAENAPNCSDLLTESNLIRLELLNVYNDKEYTYFKFNIDNLSTAIYRLDYVSFTYKEPVKKRKRNSLTPQVHEMKVAASILPAVVEGKSTGTFLYAIPLFSTNEKSYLEIVVRETQGSRQVFLQIPAPQITTAAFL